MKTKETNPTRPGPPLYVNRPLIIDRSSTDWQIGNAAVNAVSVLATFSCLRLDLSIKLLLITPDLERRARKNLSLRKNLIRQKNDEVQNCMQTVEYLSANSSPCGISTKQFTVFLCFHAVNVNQR